MPRPRKRRTLTRAPKPAIYKPAGVGLQRLRLVALLLDELEALRLADLEGLTQAEAAGRMGISRSTFQRILDRAHRQVALALVEGQALQIQGGTFEVIPAGQRSLASPSARRGRRRQGL